MTDPREITAEELKDYENDDTQFGRIMQCAAHTIRKRDERIRGLEAALASILETRPLSGENINECFDRVAELFYRETGIMAPGKDDGGHGSYTFEERTKAYTDWMLKRTNEARRWLEGGGE